ncbi:MAG: hypothetical protein ABEI58_03175 [Candidatus Nanohaloarchaea archaeon]
MDKYTRESVVLAGLMGFLVAIVLFLSVYAPDPVRPPSIDVLEPIADALQPVFKGWSQLFQDIGTVKNATT